MVNDTQKTIVITGATGYLGSKLVYMLISKYEHMYNIVVLKRSTSNTFRIDAVAKKVLMYNLDEVSLDQVFEENKVDYIVHCATDYGRKSVDPMRIIDANLVLPVKLIEYGRKYNVTAFINTDTILDKGINHYSLSKKQFRDWLLSYKSSMVCVNIELGHFYGIGDDKTKFISYIIDALKRKEPTVDLTLGEQKRNFAHIDDVVFAFLLIINHVTDLALGFYNYKVCSEREISIKDTVLLLKSLSGSAETTFNFGALPYRENEVMTSETNIDAIKKLGWKESYTLEEGLSQMVASELTNKSA